MTGDLLEDAAFARNSEVSALLGIEIAQIKMAAGDIVSRIRTSNAANDNAYDAVLLWNVGNVASLAADNQIYDWKQLPYVDLESDWYNQSANEAYTILGKQYFGVSDLSYPNQEHVRYLFNKDLCRNMGLDYPYQLVYDGKWTFDAFNGYVKNAYNDLNGDGIRNKDDQYGLTVNGLQIAYQVLNWDAFPVSIGKEGFELNIYNSGLADMIDRLAELVDSPDVAISPDIGAPQYEIFNAGNALFNIYTSDPNLLRAIEFDFGYLPFPKYDEHQKDYISATLGGVIVIPISKTDEQIELVGAAIEAFSAASTKYIKDAFVSSYIENKVLRDEDSINMYRLMRDASIYDSSRIFDTTGLISSTFPYYTEPIYNANIGLASQYEKYKDRIEKALNDLYEVMSER